ncbi:hypothetical protein, partial [Streptomyces sp. WM6386]|uniref:hypothetical protein n=1 Tax=Streptomyces sp. WM6386 TaxID=1415558 RepID=UPI001F39A5B1
MLALQRLTGDTHCVDEGFALPPSEQSRLRRRMQSVLRDLFDPDSSKIGVGKVLPHQSQQIGDARRDV